jgi:hypothetical protein
MLYTKCDNCIFGYKTTRHPVVGESLSAPSSYYECRRRSMSFIGVEKGAGIFQFARVPEGKGCGDGEPKVKEPTKDELDRSWQQGFSEGEASALRRSKEETC